MRFVPRRCVYSLPKDYVDIARVFMRVGRNTFFAQRLHVEEIGRLRAVRGAKPDVPQYFCIGKTDNVIEFYPPPEKAWRFTVDYLVRRSA